MAGCPMVRIGRLAAKWYGREPEEVVDWVVEHSPRDDSGALVKGLVEHARLEKEQLVRVGSVLPEAQRENFLITVGTRGRKGIPWPQMEKLLDHFEASDQVRAMLAEFNKHAELLPSGALELIE